jgi:hypothetical protein
MPTKVGRRVSPPPRDDHRASRKAGCSLDAGAALVRDPFSDQPRGDVSMKVSLRVALNRCHAPTISKHAAGLKPAAHILIIVGPQRLGVEKLRPPLRQVVVFVHHGVPYGDLEAVPIRAAGPNVALLDNDGTERIG